MGSGLWPKKILVQPQRAVCAGFLAGDAEFLVLADPFSRQITQGRDPNTA
jgi:hypothetical protein